MGKIIRYFVIGVVAAIAFLVAVVAIFLSVFDANEYKDELSSIVLEQTGRDLQFHGDVSLTVFPALGMQLGAMSLSNAEGFGPKPMIKVKQASISVDLGSLIAFQPEVDKLVLLDLEVDVQKNADGRTNWDDLIPAETDQSGGTGGDATESSSSAPAHTLRGAFGGLDLQNIQLSWIDRQANTELQIRDLDLSTGRIVPNQAFPLKLHVDASASGGHEVVIELETEVEYLIAQQQLTLSGMQLALNEFQIGGQLQLRNFARPALTFDVNSPELDIDALLADQPAAETATVNPPAAGNETAAEDVPIELPLQTLRDLDIDGRLGIARLRVQNLEYSDVQATLKAQQGVVSVKPLTMKAYDGEVESNVAIDVRGDIPKYGVTKSIRKVRIGDLLKDYSGEDFISGTLSAETNMTTRGEWVSELKQHSNGTMQLELLDGALQGFNLRHAIDSAKARVRGKAPPSDEPLQTDFSSLTVSGVVREGIFSSDDLELQAPLLRVGGKGSANIVTEIIDYLVNVELVGTLEGQAGQTSDELDGLIIPVAVTGPFSAAEIDVQLDELLKARADAEKAQLKSEIEKQKQELKQQLEAEKKALDASRKLEAEKEKLKDELLKNLLD